MDPILKDVLSAVPDGVYIGKESIRKHLTEEPVSILRYDSRLATAGTVFFCLVGKTADGHLFAPAAYRNGCRVFVV
jgi:UDP-N-acetylmuramyl pentapeptide synthase